MKKARIANLAISAIPFRSSNLAIPVSPFSPQLPITPPPVPISLKAANISASVSWSSRTNIAPTVSPPKSPLNWVWQCHVCHIRYPLGVTRRCLEDGHHFCAGTTVVKTKRGRNGERTRVVRRHKACSSEFDYQGWKAWGDWRRNEEEVRKFVRDMIAKEEEEDGNSANTLGLGMQWRVERRLSDEQQQTAAGAQKKDCWHRCDYPSECRWGAQFRQQKTPTAPATPALKPTTSSPSEFSEPVTPLSPPQEEPIMETAMPATTFDTILENIDLSPTQNKSADQSGSEPSPPQKEAFWGALLASATRRKSVGSSKTVVSSPLTLAPVLEQDESDSSSSDGGPPSPPTRAKLAKDMDGDIEMTDRLSMGSNYVAASDSHSKMKSPEPTLQMPNLATGFNFGFESASKAEGQGNSERKGKEKEKKKKGYIGYVETLRKINRGY
ncbi:hypothetical protein NA57DRAFT_53557 [Rhizodiscina lignyota]|uniref:Uncharacterized protein n=1 Tax=Rhizodiscina lignyota TaxID=1504668 RepID=A0A9P4IKY0_9PEZI|nr:hypothetical protein NA57DRAFT_53557 [Rhizodiscina lignyota]